MVALLPGLVLLLIAVVVVYIIFKIGKVIMGLITNIILGFASIFVLDTFFQFTIPYYNWVTIIVTALLGVIGVIGLAILNYLGVHI